MVINRRSSHSVLGVYECLASFSSSAAEGQNVTVAVYNVTAPHTRGINFGLCNYGSYPVSRSPLNVVAWR